MGPANLISLVVMTLVFILWAVLMFRTLWRLTQRSRQRLEETGGGYFTWVGHSLRSFSGFLTSDKDRQDRRRILFVTLVLMLVILLRAFWLTRLS